MKDYMNNNERMQIIALLKCIEQTEDLIKGQLMTKEERANLKRGCSFLTKSILAILKRMNSESIKAFNNTLKQTSVFVSSKYEIDQYVKRKNNDLNASYEENREYIKLIELIMYYNCRGCLKDGNKCDFYKEFEENMIPNMENEGNMCNCRYAY